MHNEAGFSLILVSDPRNLYPNQSSKIHIDDEYICACDGILYNKNDLIAQLGIPATSGNERIIVSSFKKWGKLFADKFDGKFSYVIWDRENKKLSAARDALGYGNFCYSQNNDAFFFSSDLACLLDQPQIDKSVNRKRFYQCFRYSNNSPDQTYFEHCHYCPPSHVLEFSNVISTTDYWQLGKKPLPTSDADELSNCKKYISLINDAITKESSEKPDYGLMLSGGFDSNLLAAIIARNSTWKHSLTCYSYIFDEHKSCDESRIINKTVEKLDLDSLKINADAHNVFADLSERTVFKDFVNLDGYAALPELIFKQAKKETTSLLVLGHFGDDLFGGNRYIFADLISTRDFKSIYNLVVGSDNKILSLRELINFGIRPLLPVSLKALYRKINKPKNEGNYFAIRDNQINNIDEELKFSDAKTFHQQNLLKLIYYTNTSEGIYYYRKHLYLEHGLNYVMPYYSKCMIEFFWNLPIIQLNKPDNYRWLQQQSLRLLGMHDIADSNNKAEFTELFSTGITKHRKRIIQLIKNCKLKDEIDFPEKLMKKLETNAPIESFQAGVICQYVLTAIWWQAIHQVNESFNQPNQIEIQPDKLICKKKKYGR